MSREVRKRRIRTKAVPISEQIRPMLLDRREKLSAIIQSAPKNPAFAGLWSQVNSAVTRLHENRYGICEVCGKEMDSVDLLANPLLANCVSHLPPDEQGKIFQDRGMAESLRSVALFDDVRGAGLEVQEDLGAESGSGSKGASPKEIDLDINRARRIQLELLPESHVRFEHWEVFYEYIPAGPLGGDYCDLVRVTPGEFFLLLGDAMGKGIAASMIAARLHALFRTLLDLKLPLADLLNRANRIFCDCVLASGNYATLVCGRVATTGSLEIINAGHLPPLLVGAHGAERVLSTGLPLGLFFSSAYEVTQVDLSPGDTLLFYTDGITEERDAAGNEYGHERLAQIAFQTKDMPPDQLVRACHEDVTAFTSKVVFSDDFTLLALRRVQ